MTAQKDKEKTNLEANGVETLETGMSLLEALIRLGRPSMLKTLSEAAQMSPSKAHRYLVSLQRMGFVDRDAASGYYKLGQKAAHVGLAALASADPVRLATQIATELRERFDVTTLVAVWGNHGPTIVRIEEGSRPEINARTGTVVSLLSSSSGRVFAAYLPQRAIKTILQHELKINAKRKDPHFISSMSDAQALIAETRKNQMGYVAGNMTPGVNALAAPIFDYKGYPAAVVAITKAGDGSDAGLQGPMAAALQELTKKASTEIGYCGI